MSRYNIPAMQASGMTTQQINNYIKQQDANIYGPRGGTGPKVPVKPQVMPPVKPNPVKGQQVGSMPPVKKGLLGGINPNAKPPSGIDLEKIRQGVQSLPKGIMDDDFVPKTPLSNMPFGQRLQGMMQSFGQLGQNNASKPSPAAPMRRTPTDLINQYTAQKQYNAQKSGVTGTGSRQTRTEPSLNDMRRTIKAIAGPIGTQLQSARSQRALPANPMKKGGEAKKYTKGGKINLDACGVSTAQKSKSSPKW